MKILITGSNGFIGSNLCKYVSSFYPEFETVGVDINSTNSKKTPTTYFVHGPYQSEVDLIRSGNFDAVVHLAAITDTLCFNEGLLNTNNVEGTKELARVCADTGTFMVFASSCSIYGQKIRKGRLSVGDEWDPDKSTGPLNPYGKSKQLAEEGLTNIAGLEYVCFRFSNVFGYGELRKGRMASYLSQLALQHISKRKMKLFKDSVTAKRDYIPVDRVCHTMVQAIIMREVHDNPVYNLGSGTALSFGEVVEYIAGFEQGASEVQLIENPHKALYQYNTLLNVSDLEEAFTLKHLEKCDIFDSISNLYSLLSRSLK
ncbi:NAD-dependent epimerase/dehydratase family protein [Corynebacterium sp. CCM 9203]|uniref:NAD-dependent epimerase/dehydratase family protein n=1 Tax=Corynebacterium sp. CCM 9203 TaxID=3057615 RepID=UPI003523C283